MLPRRKQHVFFPAVGFAQAGHCTSCGILSKQCPLHAHKHDNCREPAYATTIHMCTHHKQGSTPMATCSAEQVAFCLEQAGQLNERVWVSKSWYSRHARSWAPKIRFVGCIWEYESRQM